MGDVIVVEFRKPAPPAPAVDLVLYGLAASAALCYLAAALLARR